MPKLLAAKNTSAAPLPIKTLIHCAELSLVAMARLASLDVSLQCGCWRDVEWPRFREACRAPLLRSALDEMDLVAPLADVCGWGEFRLRARVDRCA